MYAKKHKLLAIVFVLSLCFGLAACGSGGEKTGGSSAVSGTWTMTEIARGSSQVSAQDYMKSAETDKVPTLTFENGGKVTLDANGNTGEGKWIEENGKYTITYKKGEDEMNKEVKLQDNKLIMEQNGYLLTYEKQ